MKWIGQRKVGFIGTGNMAQAIMSALIESKTVSPAQILASNRSDKKLARVVEHFGITGLTSNEAVVEQADVIVLAMKPQDLFTAIEPIVMSFGAHHMVASLSPGITLKRLENLLREVRMIARIMPNTSSRVRKSVTGYCISHRAANSDGWVQDLCNPLGTTIPVAEGEAFEALTVACSSGVGFVFEFMDYWIEWLEGYGFDYPTAKAMAVQTFLGAAQLAEKETKHTIEELQNQVVSKKGVTAAGLDSMRELEIERLLRYSFEKAVLRDRELAQK